MTGVQTCALPIYIIDALFDTANVRAIGEENAIKNNVAFTFKDIIFFD